MVTMGVAEPAPEVERAGRGVARLDLEQDAARAAVGRLTDALRDAIGSAGLSR